MIFSNKKILAGFFFILFLISFIITVNARYDNFNISYGSLKMNGNFAINIEGGGNVKVFADNKEILPYNSPLLNSYKIYGAENKKIKNVTLRFDDKIDNIAVFAGKNLYYYRQSDIEKFEKTKDGDYILPSYVKYCKNSKYITDKGLLNKISVIFLSIFYNFKFYILPLIFLFIFFYLLYKEKITFWNKMPDWLPLSLVLLITAGGGVF